MRGIALLILSPARSDFCKSFILIDLYPADATNKKIQEDTMCLVGKPGRKVCLVLSALFLEFPALTSPSPLQVHNANICIQYKQAQLDTEAVSVAHRLSELFKSLDEFADQIGNEPIYPGYQSDLTGKQAFGQEYEKIRKIKGKYDPSNVFRRW